MHAPPPIVGLLNVRTMCAISPHRSADKAAVACFRRFASPIADNTFKQTRPS
jgi:hypothetical protein